MKKKILSMLSIGIAVVMSVVLLASCQSSSEVTSDGTGTTESKTSSFDKTSSIDVISREDGSGTRGAFIELVGLEYADVEGGDKVDHTSDSVNITSSTGVMMTTVSGDVNAVGYISLGSLDDTVKALEIDGAEATAENIKNGTYTISRPFNIATSGEISESAQDFIDYILSSEGQQIIEDNGYISAVENASPYSGSKPTGTVTVAGSSSVTPVMEKLQEAYKEINPNTSIEINMSDSTTGMNSVSTGVCDIGMASREAKDSELEKGIQVTSIAIDGIAVIVNNDNPMNGLTTDDIKSIYDGTYTTWESISGAEWN